MLFYPIRGCSLWGLVRDCPDYLGCRGVRDCHIDLKEVNKPDE